MYIQRVSIRSGLTNGDILQLYERRFARVLKSTNGEMSGRRIVRDSLRPPLKSDNFFSAGMVVLLEGFYCNKFHIFNWCHVTSSIASFKCYFVSKRYTRRAYTAQKESPCLELLSHNHCPLCICSRPHAL